MFVRIRMQTNNNNNCFQLSVDVVLKMSFDHVHFNGKNDGEIVIGRSAFVFFFFSSKGVLKSSMLTGFTPCHRASWRNVSTVLITLRHSSSQSFFFFIFVRLITILVFLRYRRNKFIGPFPEVAFHNWSKDMSPILWIRCAAMRQRRTATIYRSAVATYK